MKCKRVEALLDFSTQWIKGFFWGFFFLRLYLAEFGKDNVELENLQWL